MAHHDSRGGPRSAVGRNGQGIAAGGPWPHLGSSGDVSSLIQAPLPPPPRTSRRLRAPSHRGTHGAEPDATNCGAVAWTAACRHLARDTGGLRQYGPTDRTALASTVAAVTMGPVAAWPAQLLPHVPC